MQLVYAIKYVADMDKAVAFHRDILGLNLSFTSPFWTEFETGGTTLALHAADEVHKPGSVQLGFRAEDLDAFYAAREANGVTFTQEPTAMHGMRIARFRDSEGAETSLSG